MAKQPRQLFSVKPEKVVVSDIDWEEQLRPDKWQWLSKLSSLNLIKQNPKAMEIYSKLSLHFAIWYALGKHHSLERAGQRSEIKERLDDLLEENSSEYDAFKILNLEWTKRLIQFQKEVSNVSQLQ